MENNYRLARSHASSDRIRRILDDNSRHSVRVSADRGSGVCPGASLAMVYSPYQEWNNLYDLESGFCAGTVFKDLDKPFLGAMRNGGVFNG